MNERVIEPFPDRNKMSRALCPSDVVTDCFGMQYQRITTRGNGFCGYSSIAYCLTGNQHNYGSVIEDCCNVFANCPELLLQRTNFGAKNQSRNAASQYYWHMRAAIRRVQSGDSLTTRDDEICWMEDAHIISVCLLYDVAIFTYSTVAQKWFAFNEQARGGYICLLSSANHTDVLHGICDSSGRRLPPTVPQSYESQAVSLESFSWSETVSACIRRHCSRVYVWPWPQVDISSGFAVQKCTAEVDQQIQSTLVPETDGSEDEQTVVHFSVQSQQCDNEMADEQVQSPLAPEAGYHCDVAGCQFGPVRDLMSLTMHKIRCHAKSRRSATSVAEDSNPVQQKRHKQAYYCDEENCTYGPVWKVSALNMHKMNCHCNNEKEKSSGMLSDGKENVKYENISQEKETQQCPECKKYFKTLDNHKKCPKKAPKLSPVLPKRQNQTTATDREKNDDKFFTLPLWGQCRSVLENTNGDSRGSTRKDRLRYTLKQEIDQLKKDLQKGARTTSKQYDPLYDSLKQYHDCMRMKVCNTTTEKLPAEVVDVVSNTDLIGQCDRKFCWTKDDEERLNRLNVDCKMLQSRSEWTWGAPDDSPQGVYNDKRMQFCIDKECQWRIIECPQCLSTGILVGMDQIDASVCYDCVQQQTSQRNKSMHVVQKNQAWEKVRPISQEYPKRMEPGHEQEDLPYLQPGDKAVMAPIHPVVTVEKNFFAGKKLRQESISLVQDCSPTLCKILPRTNLSDRFMVIERTAKDASKRYIVANPERVRQWLRYLFSHHKEFMRMKDSGELTLSEDAIAALESQEELAEVDDKMVEHGTEEARKLEEEMQRDDDGLVQPALTSGFSESHVYSFDKYPDLYLKTKEVLRIRKEGKIEIVEDNTVRRPSYNSSASLAFPHLYANGEMSPLDFGDYKLSRHLLKKQALYAHRMADGRLQYNYAQDGIHMAHQYSRLNEQTVHANVAYYISQHPEAAHVSIDSVIKAFRDGFDDQGLIDSHLPDLTCVMSQIPNTRQRWFSERLGIEQISKDLGDPNLFLTINMDPRAWPDVRRLIHKLEYGEEMPRDQHFEKNTTVFTELINKYAPQVAIYLYRKCHMIVRAFLCDICGIAERSTGSDFRKQDVTEVGWFWGRVEFSETRGCQHWHYLVKLPHVLDTK